MRFYYCCPVGEKQEAEERANGPPTLFSNNFGKSQTIFVPHFYIDILEMAFSVRIPNGQILNKI